MADIFALDVSMGKSYCVWYRGKHCLKEFSLVHTRAGFNALRDMIKKAQKPIIYFEATGIYSRVIEHFCETNGLRFCRLNPLELHLKSESLRRVKTDQKDAHRIALTVQENTFRLTVPWKKDYLQLHELSRFYNQLNADWNYRLNHLHTALEQVFPELKQLFVNRTSKLALNIVELFPHPALVRPYSRVKLKNILMASTDKRISKMKAYKYAGRLIDLAQKSYPAVSGDAIQVDEVRYYARQLIALTRKKEEVIKRMESIAQRLPEYILYCSFPGIGKQTAAQLMGELGDISRFDNANQLNAFVGIDIRRYQSGTYLGQDHINKRGNPIARKLLYFTVGNMIRQQHAHSNHIVDYYYRLKEKRPHPKLNKVAMVACMNKTLKCLLSMIKHHEKYHYRYTDSIVPVKA
ncbi:IS110 family transposase [Limosilactobacillus reuteri]|uniref:Transposase n=2 Tax=Limosilactobacillus reuteri TaxID=1598 RepID=F8DKV6_LIMRS|nr:IS110 family transposase [Limosilactobacillus reuteri]AEI56411.1 transposase [Limosilactobacillus reuteri SD2112]UIN26160.1 IS110 family transposase [Limosilactobacillus reuteri]UIT55024.1 IS110 family transposase [Limosilactobacillus reuteri]